MAEDVKLPGAGPVSRKTLIYGGSAAGAYVAWRWWRARKASAAAGPAPLPVDTSNTSAGQGATGFTNPDPAGSAPTSVNTGGLTSNAAWESKAVGDLSNIGYNAQSVAEALGLYLSGQPLSGDQALIVRVVWGMEGKPPESTNLAIVPAQSPPSGGVIPPLQTGPPPPVSSPPPPAPAPAPKPAPAPAPAIPPGYRMQPPQFAVLPPLMSLHRYWLNHYGTGNPTAGDRLRQFNPTIPWDWTAHGALSLKVSEAHLVPNF